MKVTLQQTQKLFTEGELKFESLVLSLLVTRLKIMYSRAPSEKMLEECNTAINSFLDRFKDGLAADYEIIAKL